MSLFEQIKSDVVTAMKAKDQDRVNVLRFLQSAIKNREIELRPKPLNDEETISVIKKSIKQRRDSIEQFQKAAREDLVNKELNELKILEEYLPKAMTTEQIQLLVDEVIISLNATSIKQMGSVIKEVSSRSKGSADNKIVSEIVKMKLNK